MITIDNYRVSSVTIDITGNPPKWMITGYFITTGGKILHEWVYSTDVGLKKMGAEFIRPSESLMKLSDLMLEEVHKLVNKSIWKDFGYVEEKTSSIAGVKK
jgi:hypothetical protein